MEQSKTKQVNRRVRKQSERTKEFGRGVMQKVNKSKNNSRHLISVYQM